MDNRKIPDISALSDAELRMLVEKIAAAAGAPYSALGSVQDMGKLRTMVGSMSDAEIQRLIERAGKDKAARIYEALNGGK